MNVIIKRNIKLFFRDKVNLFFSLLAIIIIIVLYVLFLGNVWGDARVRALPYNNVLRYTWLAAGLLVVATITTPMNSLSLVIEDKLGKIYKGFHASPVKRSRLTSGYIISAFLVGVIMASITAVFWGIFIAHIGGGVFPAIVYLRVAGIILLASLSNTAMVYFIVSFCKTHAAFGTASTLLSTLIGFLMGIYMPIGVLPETVQTVIKLFPPSHSAMLLRQTLMEIPMQVSFEGVPVQYLDGFQEMMGVVFRFGDFEITPIFSVIGLLALALIFYGLSLLNIRRKSN